MNGKNRFITFTALGKAELTEESLNIPPDTSDMVFVRNSLTLVSPGTELAFFSGTHSSLKNRAKKFPCWCGYSSVGIVENTGRNVKDVKPGDQVVTMSGHCERAWAEVYYKVPSGLASDKAVFAILGSIALHGIRLADPRIGHNVLVSGLGAIGQMATRFCHISGVLELVGTDIYPFRLEMAEAGGVDYTLNALDSDFTEHALEHTDGNGFNIVIEASGNPEAIVKTLSCTAKRGKIIVLGSPREKIGMDFYEELQKKEIAIIGAYQPNCPEFNSPYYPWSKKRNSELVMEYQLKEKIDFSPLITHRGEPAKAQEFYDVLSKEKNKSITAVFEWSGC